MTTLGIHLFRKDLRVYDNRALNELSKRVDKVIGVFIFDPAQITSKSVHCSHKAAQFVIESVNDLDGQTGGKLVILYGDPPSTLEELISTTRPDYLSFNSDFSPYSLKRDMSIARMCVRHNVALLTDDDDQTLIPMESLIKKDGSPYMVFGGFYKNLTSHSITKPHTRRVHWIKPRVAMFKDYINLLESRHGYIRGGRAEALRKLNQRQVINNPDHLSSDGLQLSAYMNFGCISIREAHASKPSYLKTFSWRDFFLCIYRFATNGNSYTKHMDLRYDRIKWPAVKMTEWNKFLNCDTGFLLIDAAMRELLERGLVNNRARLLLATFWIKYLMISPFNKSYGSQAWFSKLLIDCSSSQNKLNHQWVIGDLDLSGRRFKMTGTHSLTGRMMRIDNDMIKRYDPEFAYIKKWIPAFKSLSIRECKALAKRTTQMYEWRARYAKYSHLFNKL
jgi:deoxyribodipyrimidine photo-lyase